MSSNVSVGLARLLAIIKALNINTLRCQHIAFMALQLKERSQRQHREILDACHAGDVEGAIRALESHLSESSQYFVILCAANRQGRSSSK